MVPTEESQYGLSPEGYYSAVFGLNHNASTPGVTGICFMHEESGTN